MTSYIKFLIKAKLLHEDARTDKAKLGSIFVKCG